MFEEPFATMSAFDKSTVIAFFVTIALAVILLAVFFITKKLRPESLDNFKKTTLGVVVGYAIGLISILLFLKLDGYFADGYVDLTTFIPVVCLLGIVIILAIVGLIISILKKDSLALFGKISLGIIGAGFLAIIIAHMVLLYKDNESIDVANEVLLYVFTALLFGVDILLVLLFGKKRESNRTKTIVYGGILMAMSFALSYIKLFSLPQGGSITFVSMLPLMIFSYMFGIRKGFLLGIVYGLLQFIQSPWFYHPMQFLLDYPVAFAGLGLAGLFRELKIFKNKKIIEFILGAILAGLLRYFGHVLSGVFVFGSDDPNYSAVAWSFLYNAFTLADIAICIVAGSALFLSKSFTRYIDKVHAI